MRTAGPRRFLSLLPLQGAAGRRILCLCFGFVCVCCALRRRRRPMLSSSAAVVFLRPMGVRIDLVRGGGCGGVAIAIGLQLFSQRRGVRGAACSSAGWTAGGGESSPPRAYGNVADSSLSLSFSLGRLLALLLRSDSLRPNKPPAAAFTFGVRLSRPSAAVLLFARERFSVCPLTCFVRCAFRRLSVFSFVACCG